MGALTNVFYLISTALLIPVMLALLWLLVRVLLFVGQTLREHRVRAAARRQLATFAGALERGSATVAGLPKQGLVPTSLRKLCAIGANDVLAGKVIDECRLVWQDELDRLSGMARSGPALGLMGTLIPLGPALVGLAAGNLEMMSKNLVIAFATTVVGLLVGTIAAFLLGVKRRWYRADALLVTFTGNRWPQLRQCRLETAGEDCPAGSVADLEGEAVPEMALAANRAEGR